ncbi:MAG: S8 family peptidase [Magnetococcales bacterium]|nr:S8 family peptidase [Magnetococcales bacterium]
MEDNKLMNTLVMMGVKPVLAMFVQDAIRSMRNIVSKEAETYYRNTVLNTVVMDKTLRQWYVQFQNEAIKKGSEELLSNYVKYMHMPQEIMEEKRKSFIAEYNDYIKQISDVLSYSIPPKKTDTPDVPSASIWNVNLNRRATISLHQSRNTVKVDAAERVFAHDTSNITWAVVDSGIDANHPAFKDRTNKAPSRVTKIYDFASLRNLLANSTLPKHLQKNATESNQTLREQLNVLREHVHKGRPIDWSIIEPLITVSPTPDSSPKSPHGTHVAGILAADWRKEDEKDEKEEDRCLDQDLQGMCPEMRLLDIRVFDENGKGDEFTIISALQFIAYLNRNRDMPVVHGVNLSLSLVHNVTNFACGQTPICLECERLIGHGIVVVAAAGNGGHQRFSTERGYMDGYHAISITDPGNADGVITVGATHRGQPHAYGISYFSSRGPTGDGRSKPDLVAPGEKILSSVPNKSTQIMDGTSMAAPHVSGAAAILMARHKELVGKPHRIKEILCNTATDLKREKHFQGAGLLDVLRAMESI